MSQRETPANDRCDYHPIYRSCRNCGADMERGQVRKCLTKMYQPTPDPRIAALRDARALILRHAQSAYRGGLVDRSNGITEVLADFDLRFPEVLE